MAVPVTTRSMICMRWRRAFNRGGRVHAHGARCAHGLLVVQTERNVRKSRASQDALP